MLETPLERPLVRFALELTLRGVVALALGALAGSALVAIDTRLGLWLPLSRGGVEPLLVTLAGAILTVVVFAVWMRAVVVGLVSSRFSPRTTSSYLDDHFQRSITTWLITGFALLLTVAIRVHGLPAERVPALGVLASVVVVVAGLLGLLLAVRHATMSLALPELIRQLADQAIAGIDARDQQPDDEASGLGFLPVDKVIADELGWVQRLGHEDILAAVRPGVSIRLEVATGGFVVPGDAVASSSVRLSEEESSAVRDAIRLARVRRVGGDLAYALQELLDVGEFAASSSSSDISTGLEVVVHLEAALARLVEVGVASGHRRGEDGRQVLAGANWTVADHLSVVTSRLRHATAGDPIISRELIQALERLMRRSEETGRDEARRVLEIELVRLREESGAAEFVHPTIGVRAGNHL